MLGNKTDNLVNPAASINDTVRLIIATGEREQNSEAVNRLLQSVNPKAYRNTIDFLAAVFAEIKARTTYKPDDIGLEQIKTPDRFLLKDGFGDCDDYATLWSAVLNRVGIKHLVKIVKYDPNGGWAHVYIQVPFSGRVVTLDNVLGTFNKEVRHAVSRIF